MYNKQAPATNTMDYTTITPTMLHQKLRQPFINAQQAVDIKPLHQNDTTEEKIQYLKHSVLLQPGNSFRESNDLIEAIITTGEDWATNVCCPSVNTTLLLHIAKELILNFQVTMKEAPVIAKKLYTQIIKDDRSYTVLKERLNRTKITVPGVEEVYNRLIKNHIKPQINSLSWNYCQENIIDIQRKKIFDREVGNWLKTNINKHFRDSAPDRKCSFAAKHANHLITLGPPASGKSTFIKKYFPNGTHNAVSICSDSYRPFSDILTGQQHIDGTQSNSRAANTQDIAYLIKNLVIAELINMKKLKLNIPNIIFDNVTYDHDLNLVLDSDDNVKVILAAFTGLHGDTPNIAERAMARAKFSLDPADAERVTNIKSLLTQHVNASLKLPHYLPELWTTSVYNTNTREAHEIDNQEKAEIAQIDPEKCEINVENLIQFSSFLCKKNLNTKATHPLEMILSIRKTENIGGITGPKQRAQALLDLISTECVENPAINHHDYTINLLDYNKDVYASISFDESKIKYELTIENQAYYNYIRNTKENLLAGQIIQAIEQNQSIEFKQAKTRMRYNSPSLS